MLGLALPPEDAAKSMGRCIDIARIIKANNA
jgi:hypothetical protein